MPATIKLLSYNIRSMRDDRAALIRVLRRLEPDVACLQEVPRFLAWRAKRNRLAAAGGLAVGSGRRVCGLAVLAGPGAHLLRREYHRLSRTPGTYRRGLAIAVLDVGGARIIAASCHLDLRDEPRVRHAREIIELLDRVRDRFAAPVVLAGDINEPPGGAAWNLLAERFTDAYAAAPRGGEFTYSSSRPVRRIDGVFTSDGLEVVGAGVPEDPQDDYPRATDHLPVLAELRR